VRGPEEVPAMTDVMMRIESEAGFSPDSSQPAAWAT
jgi:hypothetical protein